MSDVFRPRGSYTNADECTAGRPMKFWWWDDAYYWAVMVARDTEIRHKVYRGADGQWTVDPADHAALALEPCS